MTDWGVLSHPICVKVPGGVDGFGMIEQAVVKQLF
jgi:hypothetical protein